MLYDTKWDAQAAISTDLFLSPKELGISAKARDALITVLGMMERGKIQYTKKSRFDDLIQLNMPDHLIGLQMSRVWSQHECGTAGCLLGWARWVAEDYFLLPPNERSDELENLFCMGGYSGHKYIGYLTPADVAPALRSWLTTGRVVWPC